MTEQEWKTSAVSNAPKAPDVTIELMEGRISLISIIYGQEGVEGEPVPLAQARADSKKLLPRDSDLKSEGRIYEHDIYSIAVDTYVSPALADFFKSEPDIWKAAEPGTFTVSYALYGNKDLAGNMSITLGKQGPILEEWGIDPDTYIPPTKAVVPVDAVVNDDNVNLREGPGLNYPSVAKYNRGTTLGVVGKDETGQWLKVYEYKNGLYGPLGWMMSQYITVYINRGSVPVAQAPPPPQADVSELGIGASYTSWGLIAVSAFVERDELGYHDAGYGGKFVVVNIVVTNSSSSDHNVALSPFDFRLVSADGVSVSFDAATYALETSAFRSVQLEPEAVISGMIAYKVREDFVPAKLVYDSLFETVTITFKQQ